MNIFAKQGRFVHVEITKAEHARPELVLTVGDATATDPTVHVFLDENHAIALARAIDAAVAEIQARAVSL